ncbi:MAG TPA: universal stress protein [Candidatus Limnocylindria bacterium]
MSAPRPADETGRPTPEQMLERVRREAGAGARGRHRMYVGMAPGVGKTYAALDELRRRRDRGTDAVVGLVETYGRPLTIAAIGDLEVVPRRQVEYKGVRLEEMDTDAVIRRRPDVVLVDEIAHTNAPGSKHAKRWQDVEELLDHGITVISTMNVQHLEGLADIVEHITGVKVTERVPDDLLDRADEVQLVDMTPHALRQRIRHGNVYPPERASQALENYFREGNLTALRELVLRRLSSTVEEDLEAYMRGEGIDEPWPASEAVIVVLDPSERSQDLVRRAWRSADALRAPLLGVWVETPSWSAASPEDRAALEANIRLAEDVGAEVVRTKSNDPAAAILQLVRDRNAESVFVRRPRPGRLAGLSGRRSLADELVQRADSTGIHVCPDPED